MPTLKGLYKAMKAGDYDVPATYEDFEHYMTSGPQNGYAHRKKVYDDLKAAGSEMPSYEEFSRALFKPASRAAAKPGENARRIYDDLMSAKKAVESSTQPKQPQGYRPSQQEQAALSVGLMQDNERKRRAQGEFDRTVQSFGKPGGIQRTEYDAAKGKFETAYYSPDGRRSTDPKHAAAKNREYWSAVSRRSHAQDEFDKVTDGILGRRGSNGRNAAENAWAAAEKRDAAQREKSADRTWDEYAALGGGWEMRATQVGQQSGDKMASHMTNFDLDRMMDDAWASLGQRGQKELIGHFYSALSQSGEYKTPADAMAAAEKYARAESDRRLYGLAVEKNMPKSKLEYFARKVGDANLLKNIATGIAVMGAGGKTGDMAAREAANEQYRQDGHKVLDVAGTVAGFALDPTTWLSAGVGSTAAKGAMWAGGRWLAGKGASTAVKQAATRQFATSMTGRIAGGVVGGAANFGTFEGVKEMESQFAHGGHVEGQDETGKYINDGYSAGAVAGQFGHGLLMGGAIGWLTPVSGNVADKLVRGTSSTVGKVAGRAGVYTGATMAEGTIFSVPEWMEVDRDGFDVWTDNMAMMVGFKTKHMLKSAGGVLGDLKASFDSPTNGAKNRLDFESRLRQRMDAPSDGDMALTKDEEAELKRYGYGLREIVENQERQDAPNRGQDAPEIVSRLTEMVTDPRVSEAARAKMYYYATGRKLPMSTIMKGELIEDGNGGFTVESQGANGVITSRSFKNRKEADLELERIHRQAELNSIELGERYQQAVDLEDRLDVACSVVAEENGWKAEDVYRICEAARTEYLRGGDKQLDEAQQNILRKVTDAMGDYDETGATDAIRGRINEKYGVDIDGAIRKEANRRTQAEQTAIDEYINELIPDKAKERPVEDAGVEDVTDQGLLTDEPEQPGNDIPGGEQKPVGRAVMKYQDRPVEVLSGRVVMMEDGSMVDNGRSDNSIVIRDLATGKVEMVSPDAIRSYEEYAPGDEAGLASGQGAAPEVPAAAKPKYTSGEIRVRKPDGTEGLGFLTGYVDGEDRHEYYLSGDQGRIHYATEGELDSILLDYKPDETQETGVADVEQQGHHPYALNDEFTILDDGGNPVSGMVTGELDVDGFVEIETEKPINGRKVNLFTPEELDAMVHTYGGVEETPASLEVPQDATGNGVAYVGDVRQPGNGDAMSFPAGEVQDGTAKTSAFSKIPVDGQGQPMLTDAAPDTVWDALVERSHGDGAIAGEVAADYLEDAENDFKAAEKELKKLQEGKPEKRKSGSPAPTLDERIAAKEAAKAALAGAQEAYDNAKAVRDHWQKVVGTVQRRQEETRRQQEAEARQRAAERAEAEKAEREAREEAERLEREALEGIPEWHMDTPENARKRGARRYGGQMFTRQEPVHGVDGKEVEVKFSQKDLPNGRVAVIEAEQLQPSHIQGQRNPMFFIEEAQPKDRSEAVSVNAARDMAEGIRPQEITGSATAYTGAPTVNTRGEVIQGNNRSDALRYLWQNNLPEQQQAYRQYLIDHAGQLGLDTEAVGAMQHPVLVNMLDVDDAEAIRLGQMTAQDTESGGIERIRPKNVAQKLGDDMRTFANQLLGSSDDEATFGQLVDRNGGEVLRWMSQVGAISNTQFRSAFDSKGNLTAEAKNDLQKVLYQAVFKGGSQQLEEMFDRLPAKAQRAILSTAFRDMESPFAGRMLPEIQSSIVAYNELMQDGEFASASKLDGALRAVEAFKRQISLDDRLEEYMPADNFSNFALHLAAMYKAGDMSQSTIAGCFNQMYDLAQGKKAATLFEEADTTEYPLAEVVKQVLGIDYKPAKNGNNNVADGGADVALHNQDGQGGEPRGNEPPASGEQTPAGTEPSERGGGTADDGRGGRTDEADRGNQETPHQETLSEEDAESIIAKMELSAVDDPQIPLSPDSWQKSFGLANSIDTPLGKVKMGEGQYQKLIDKKRSSEFGMVVQTLKDPDVVLIEPSEAKEGQVTERDYSYVFVKTFIRDGKKLKYYTSVSVLKDGMEVSVSSHIANKSSILKKLRGMERAYTKESLLPNSSEWHLAEHPTDVPDLLPTQGKSDANLETSEKNVSDRKINNSASEKQGIGEKSSLQPSENEGKQTLQASIDAAASEVDTAPTPAQAEAGNYRKGHVTIGDFDITIENPAGSTRKGVDADGKEWSTTMANTYGYIKGTEGVDGDHIDVFLHTDMDQWDGRKVFVVDQTNRDGSFDEHKVMLGFNDKDEAMGAYLANYDATWAQTHPGLRISETSTEEFNKWVGSSHRKTKPFAEYSTVKKGVLKAGEVSDGGAHKLPGRLRSAYEEGNSEAIRDAEAAIREYIMGSDEYGKLYATYLNASKDMRMKGITAPEKKTLSFIAKTCREAGKAAGFPSGVFGNERVREELASTTEDARVLEMMASYPSMGVLRYIVHNPHASDALLEQIADAYSNNGIDYDAREVLAQRKGEVGGGGSPARFSVGSSDAATFAGRHGLKEGDVEKYARAMKSGNLGVSSLAFKSMRRDVMASRQPKSLGEFAKIWNPIQEELYGAFGSVDALREKQVQAAMDERNMMESARRRAEEEAAAERKRMEELALMDDEKMDAEYFAAMEAGNEARMRDIVDEAARRKGYGDAESEYQGAGAWAAPSDPGYGTDVERRAALEDSGTDVNLTDIAAGYAPQPSDYFTNLHAYGNDTAHGRESATAIGNALSELMDGQDAVVKVYRAVPESIKEGKIRNGDWVTPSRKYAEMHANHRLEGKYRIIEQEVPASELWWDGNDINEWGYDDGKQYSYRNTRNNRKLHDLVTRDDNGEVIPPSRRFNSRKADVRYQAGGGGTDGSMGAYHAAKGMLESAGIKVHEVSDAEAQGMLGGAHPLTTPSGRVYGWTVGGEVYLNRDAMNPETPVHEYTHLWDDAVRRLNPGLWARGKELLRQTPVWDEVVNDPNYAGIRNDEDAVASEVHSRLSGEEGARMLDGMVDKAKEDGVFATAEAVTLRERIRKWLRDMLSYLKGTFEKWTGKDLEDLTVEEFARMPMRDLANGVDPNAEVRKERQLGRINETNPMLDDYHTGIRTTGDIRTLREAIQEARDDAGGDWDELSAYPDVDNSVYEEALESGRITVYSSKPIKDGNFVTPSRMQAEDYAGGGRVYSKTVSIDDVAWITPDEGQFASVNDGNGQKSMPRFQIIGERGARRMDKADEATVRMDNLGVAREMEKAFNEKKERIEKLRGSEPVVVTDGMIPKDVDLTDRKAVKEALRATIKGEYTNTSDSSRIQVSNKGIKEVTSHGMSNDAHVKSLFAIGPMLERSIFIGERVNEKDHTDYDKYRYYACGLKIDGEDYTAKLVIGQKNGQSYYDHRLSRIEKGKLIDSLNGLSNTVAENKLPSDGYKGTTLESLLQADEKENARKVRLATGWERGADGKWRYEVPDFDVDASGLSRKDSLWSKLPWGEEFDRLSEKLLDGKELTDEEASRFDELSERADEMRKSYEDNDVRYLDDYVKDSRLFEAYPELRQVRVEMYSDPQSNTGATYYEGENLIRVNENSLITVNLRSILSHEVQHAIQAAEGFARGGNGSTYREHLQSLKDKHDTWSMAMEFEEKGRELGKDASQMGVYEAVRDEYLQAGMTYGDGFMPTRDVFDKGFNLWARGYDGEGYEDAYNEYQRLANKHGLGLDHNRYNELAGEVEARNVQARLDMPEEERRRALLSETEDVAREDQIFLRGALGGGQEANAGYAAGDGGALDEVNRKFNGELETLTPENADRVTLSLGRPSAVLRAAGVEDRPMKLYGNKVIKKMKKHGFSLSELRNLPQAVADPIAVFKNYGKEGNRSILTELKTEQGNFLVTLSVGNGNDIDFNVVTSVFGKGMTNVVDWINNGFATYFNKQKTLDYLHHSALKAVTSDNREEEKALQYLHFSESSISEASNSERLLSAAKVVENFENPKVLDEETAENSRQAHENGTDDAGNPDIRFREVEDDAVLKEFAEGKTVKAYRTMQVIDGKLYSPMATKVGGKATPEIKLGVPEQSEEHPEIINGTKVGRDGVEQGYVVIDKGLGKGTLTVAYNPYAHTSRTVLNDQFSSAYVRPNLVTVEVEVPESELTSGYRAPMAKDAVGEISWHSGSVSGKLAALGKPRRVILTRYDRPVRIVPFSEVAAMIAEQIDGTGIEIPYNVVQPQLRTELERLGVAISDEATGTVSDASDFGKAEYVTDQEIERINAHQQEMAQTSTEAKSNHAEKLAKKFNTPIRIVNDVNELVCADKKLQEVLRTKKGFYDPASKEVVVVIPNHADVEDVAETVLHEVVAHKGLRELVGEENYAAFCDEIYGHLKEDELKRQVDEDITRRFLKEPEKGYDHARRVAVDEMFGRLSENDFDDFTEPERGIWKKLKVKVLEAINKFLGSLKLPKWVKLGDNELRYMLWRSHEKLRSKDDYVDMARDAAKREEFGLTRNDAIRERKSEEDVNEVNKRFNEQIDRWESGEMEGKEMIDAGRPMGVMRQFMPDETITLRQKVLTKSRKKHGLTAEDIKGLPGALAHPIFVFKSSPETVSVLTELKSATGQNLFVAVEVGVNKQFGHRTLEVNDILTIHGREIENVILPIVDNNTLVWADKEKGLGWLSSAKSNSQAIATQTLDDAAKVVNNFENPAMEGAENHEYRFRDGKNETEDIWKDHSVGMEERITNAAIRLSNIHSADLAKRNDARRKVFENLKSILQDISTGKNPNDAGLQVSGELTKSMSAQRKFDQSTVKRVADLARILIQNGYLSDMSSGEVKRLLSAVKNTTGKRDISDSVQKIMDIMVDNQLRNGEATLRKLLTVRGSKVDARGVEVQGALDVDGQRTVEVVKEAMSLSEDDITARIAEAQNRMGDTDQTIADNAALEYAGLNMALDYVQHIARSKTEEKDLRNSLKTAREDRDAGRMDDDAYKQFVEATEDAIRKNKVERAEAYFNLVGRLSDSMSESIENAKAFREAEKARISEIHHNANSDMEGRPTNEHHKDDWKDKFVNNAFVQFIFAPLGTFDQILRVFGNKSANGEGYLWNRFMRGWVDCRNKELSGVKEKFARLDAKAAELFGKRKLLGKNLWIDRTWGDLILMEADMPKATVSFWDGEEMRDHELTQGNLLYIYMVDKMTDGRMKLRRMGITGYDIADIENKFLDPRFKALGDWLQDEFLVDTRNEYNETHKRMFGASMAAIENYFPLKILANARVDKEEDVNQQNRPDGITTKTGSIIKRRVNNLALDVTGADALSVILDHITQMEHWNAYAEWNRDLNTLRTYKRFRNQVINMTTVYGGGRKLWEKFNDLCLMAAGEYRPSVSKFNKVAVEIARGVTAAKVNLRIYTALKQFLSAPAYIPEVSTAAIAKSIANPYGDFKWCLENMPIFRERWHSRISGDPRLLKTDMDWNNWRERVMEISSRIGMTPNAFVDAVTVSIGARAMYETRLKQYLKEGYPTDAAEKRSMQDATILFNQTQQSSESPFLSTLQVDKDWLSTVFTVFRNSSMSYTRQEFDAIRNLKRNLTPGQIDKSIEFMAKQILRDWGVNPDSATDAERDKARSTAKKRFYRQIKKDVLRLATFGFILELAWNLGPYLPYIIFGNDDDEKDKMWNDALTHAYFGSVEGLTGGDVISSFGNMAVSGEWNWNQLGKDMPLVSDIYTIGSKFVGGKNTEAINDILNLLVQMGFGWNPQSLTDSAIAIIDACGDDPALANEATIFAMRVLQVPQSQIDKMYFDEIGLSCEEASKLTPTQLAQRYAEYKVKRGTPLAPWSWGDEELVDKQKEKATRLMKERLESESGKEVTEAYADFEERSNAVAKKVKKAKDMMEIDYEKAAEKYAALQQDPDYKLHGHFTELDGDLKKLTRMWLNAKSTEEAELVASTVTSYRAGMVKALQAETEKEQESAMKELEELIDEFLAKYEALHPEPDQLKR